MDDGQEQRQRPPSRDSAADAQMQLLRVLSGKSLLGAGEDLSKLDEAAGVLRAKRRKAIASEWPGIADALGDEFEDLFDQYAARNALPSGGTGADARAFLRQLLSRGKLPEKLRVTIMNGLDGWLPMKLARLRERRGVAVAVRVPGVGIKVWAVGLPAQKN